MSSVLSSSFLGYIVSNLNYLCHVIVVVLKASVLTVVPEPSKKRHMLEIEIFVNFSQASFKDIQSHLVGHEK
jgi:hypothetical protein